MEEKKNQICQKEKFCILQTKNILQQGDACVLHLFLFVINPKDGIVNVERCQENMQKCNLKFS